MKIEEFFSGLFVALVSLFFLPIEVAQVIVTGGFVLLGTLIAITSKKTALTCLSGFIIYGISFFMPLAFYRAFAVTVWLIGVSLWFYSVTSAYMTIRHRAMSRGY